MKFIPRREAHIHCQATELAGDYKIKFYQASIPRGSSGCCEHHAEPVEIDPEMLLYRKAAIIAVQQLEESGVGVCCVGRLAFRYDEKLPEEYSFLSDHDAPRVTGFFVQKIDS